MEKLELANQAQLLRDSQAFSVACERVERDILARWEQSLTVETREAEWAKLKGLRAVRTALTGMVADGRMEAAKQEASKAPAGSANQRK